VPGSLQAAQEVFDTLSGADGLPGEQPLQRLVQPGRRPAD
jgi:hypothetical protein